MLSRYCVTPRAPTHHPFAHIALVDTTVEEAAEDVLTRPLARKVLALACIETISANGDADFRAADVRLLVKHALVRKIGRRHDGVSVLRITDKGRRVLDLP